MSEPAPWIGVWRRIGIRPSPHTHLVIEEERLWEVGTWVHCEGDPGPERSYVVRSGHLAFEIDIEGRDGPERGLLALEGARLRLTRGQVERPKNLDDVTRGTCDVYEREQDEATRTRLALPVPRVARARRVHPTLGEMTFDPNLSHWDARVAASAFPNLHAADTLSVSASLPQDASDVEVDNVVSRILRIDLTVCLRKASDQLLATHNGGWRSWNEEGTPHEGPELNAAAFEARLVLNAVAIEDEDSVGVWFDDGDLFWGHSVVVWLDEDLVPRHVTLEG